MKKRRKILSEKRVMFAFPHLFLSIVFVIIPIGILLANAFIYENSFSFSNFERFAIPQMWKTIGQSFLMAFSTTVVCFVLCYPLALALNYIKTNKTFILVMLFVLPMWVNSLLRIVATKLLFNSFIDLGFSLTLIGMVYEFMPFMLLPLYTIIANTDTSFIEASQDLGASGFKTLIKVRLPLSTPGIISGTLMVFMPCMSTFAVSEILGGSGMVMFAELIDQRFAYGAYGIGSAYSVMLMLLIAVSVIVASRLSKGKAAAATGGAI